MLKIAVAGCGGRMGREISQIAHGADGVELVGGTERPSSPFIGSDLFTVAGIGSGGSKVVEDLSEIIDDIDALIDFTAPEATMSNFDIIAEKGKIMIIGTTGLTDEQKKHIKDNSGKARCVMAPNMSVGVNLMFKLVEEATKVIGSQYDIEIIDIHHNLKKDAPSGTAVRLGEICAKGTGRDMAKVGVYGRHGVTGERTKEEIAIMTLRAGDVVGEHTVIYAGQGERVEITHKAGSRKNFAVGAVRAVKWVSGKKMGLYDMQDVLGLR